MAWTQNEKGELVHSSQLGYDQSQKKVASISENQKGDIELIWNNEFTDEQIKEALRNMRDLLDSELKKRGDWC